MGKLLFIGLDVVVSVDQELCKLPPYRLTRAVVLDRILGPAEDFEYVSTTAPVEPPITS